MKELNRKTAPGRQYTERIIQFGEGNFLRAFVDWMVWNMNEKTGFDGGVVVVQPIAEGLIDTLNQQDGLYHLILKGMEDHRPVHTVQLIDVISRGINPYARFEEYLRLAEQPAMRFIISNTTEAGISFDPDDRWELKPAQSFPGKLVQLLYHRFRFFNGAPDKGFLIFPCELIFENGSVLKDCIRKYIALWNLGSGFENWFEKYCGVYNTLVDRIVPGYPKETAGLICEEIGYQDRLLDEGEIFHLWVIEAPESVAEEFPAPQAGLNVRFVPSEAPYHERKVTLLNGSHTVLAPVGYLSGLDTVGECMDDEAISPFIHQVLFEELTPSVELPEDELKTFAESVLNRFWNPYVKHRLTSILLNSFSKFKTRDLPALKAFLKREGRLPDGLVLGLAAILYYYRGGLRGKDVIPVQDDPQVIRWMQDLWTASPDPLQVAEGALKAGFIWGEDLSEIPGLVEKTGEYLQAIQRQGMRDVVKTILSRKV